MTATPSPAAMPPVDASPPAPPPCTSAKSACPPASDAAATAAAATATTAGSRAANGEERARADAEHDGEAVERDDDLGTADDDAKRGEHAGTSKQRARGRCASRTNLEGERPKGRFQDALPTRPTRASWCATERCSPALRTSRVALGRVRAHLLQIGRGPDPMGNLPR